MPSAKDLEPVWGRDDNLKGFAQQVHTRLQAVKTLSRVTFSNSKEPFERLISETAYDVSHKLSMNGTRSICMLALDEASPAVLSARKTLLMTDEVMSLRRNLWLAINRELKANPNTVNGIPRVFSFWDQIPDSLQTSGVGRGWYSEEVAIEVCKCLQEDGGDLKALGDFLTSCRALVNNRDAPLKHRVVEQRTKELIDQLLTVTIS